MMCRRYSRLPDLVRDILNAFFQQFTRQKKTLLDVNGVDVHRSFTQHNDNLSSPPPKTKHENII